MKSSNHTFVSSEPKKRAHRECVDILVCKILIWKPSSKNTVGQTPTDENCMIIRECQEIEINETYKKLFSTATVKFPIGTVVKKTMTPDEIKKAGKDGNKIYNERMNDGVVVERHADYELAQPSHFEVGQRIRIFLGYYHDYGNKFFASDQERLKAYDDAFPVTPSFDGYIVKCSVSTPIEIKCEDLASVLKNIGCKSLARSTKDRKINALLSDDKGSLNLLKESGIKLHPDTYQCDINIGVIDIPKDWTVADLLENWTKYKLYSYIRLGPNNEPYLRIGRTVFSKPTPESIINSDQSSSGKLIEFNYNVANDNLKLMNSDPRFLAVEAQGIGPDDKYIRFTLCLNENWTGKADDGNKFRILGEIKYSKKSMRLNASGSKKPVDLGTYTVVPYISNKTKITKDELLEEASAYFDSFTMTGIEGSLTLFGDFYLKSGDKVELLDTIHPEKNGLYIVGEVTTRFGVNGYRQVIKIPYCISKPK